MGGAACANVYTHVRVYVCYVFDEIRITSFLFISFPLITSYILITGIV